MIFLVLISFGEAVLIGRNIWYLQKRVSLLLVGTKCLLRLIIAIVHSLRYKFTTYIDYFSNPAQVSKVLCYESPQAFSQVLFQNNSS